MKRFHMHVSVGDLAQSVRFYSTLFAREPSHVEADYAKWMLVQEDEQACYYARSDNYWITDPTGIAWETFHTLGRIPVYGEDTPVFDHGTSVSPAPVDTAGNSACCVPKAKQESTSGCCCT
jgi:hypothetical protein